MGAFDTYEGTAACPRCGDRYWLDGQTKFFDPDFQDLYCRPFAPGVPQPIAFTPEQLAQGRVWEFSWWRVREPVDPAALHVLLDFDELFGCACGARFASVLRFRVAPGVDHPGVATLTEIALHDAAADFAGDVDYANGEMLLWDGDSGRFAQAIHALAAEPPEVRARELHAGVRDWFAPSDPPAATSDPMTTLAGPVRCEACGDVRERELWTYLSHGDFPASFFGPTWRGGQLRPGARIDCDLAWLADDVDRNYYVRLRHPVPEDSLTILQAPVNVGCRCGAGRGSPLAVFTRDPGGVTLSELRLRVVRGREDLEDVDFAAGPYQSRERPANSLRPPRERTRAQAIDELLYAEWRLPRPH